MIIIKQIYPSPFYYHLISQTMSTTEEYCHLGNSELCPGNQILQSSNSKFVIIQCVIIEIFNQKLKNDLDSSAKIIVSASEVKEKCSAFPNLVSRVEKSWKEITNPIRINLDGDGRYIYYDEKTMDLVLVLRHR